MVELVGDQQKPTDQSLTMKDFFFEASPHLWRRPGNPSIYARTLLPVDHFFAKINNGEEISNYDAIAYVSFAIAKALKKHPRLNSYRFMGRTRVRDYTRLSYMIKSDNPQASLFIKALDIDRSKKISSLKKYIFKNLKETYVEPLASVKVASRLFRWTPFFLKGLFLKLFYFLSFQKWIKLFHAVCPRDFYGAMVISHTGSIGLPDAFIPLSKYSSNSVILSIGKIEKKLEFDENKNVVEKKYLPLGWTVDHRLSHGPDMAQFYQEFSSYFLKPELFQQ